MSHAREHGGRSAFAGLLAMLLLLLCVPAGAMANIVDDPLPPSLRSWAVDHGPLQIGYLRNAAPVGIVEDGEVIGGWAFELHELMALKLGVQVESIVFDSPDELVEGLRDGTLDLIAATGARPDLVAFAESTRPLAWTPVVFAAAVEQQRLGVDSLAGRTATTIPGSPIEAMLLADFPDVTYVPTPSIPAGVEAVAAGDIDLYLGPLAIIGHQLDQLGLVLGPVGDPVSVVEVPAWGLPGSESLQIAGIGRSLLTDSEMSVVHVRWTGFDLGEPGNRLPSWLGPVLVTAVGVMAVLAIFAMVLRRRVAAATTELRELNAELEDRVALRTEELGTANTRLKRSNTALTSFAYKVSHDLRGPITAIAGLSDILRRIDMEEDQQKELAGTINSSAMRLNTMIEAVLIDAARAGVAEPALDGPELAAWLRDVLGPEVQAIDADLRVDVPAQEITTDPTILRQAVVNLVGNALKYAVNESRTEVAVAIEAEGDLGWRLTVDDNGPGIPENLWAKIFERGYQRQDGAAHGSGLGLANVRDDVQRIGGSISVGGSDLGGARFTVMLPAHVRRQESVAIDDENG